MGSRPVAVVIMHICKYEIRIHTQSREDSSQRGISSPATQHNKHTRRMSFPSLGLEPAFPRIERPQNYALDRIVTEIGYSTSSAHQIRT